MVLNKLYGGIEGGGTKFVCMVAKSPDAVVDSVRIPTTTPAETIDNVIAFFSPYVQGEELTAIGFATFGPVDLHPESPTFGYITSTPKPGWAHSDLLSRLRQEFRLPLIFESDVNAAAWGEYFWNEDNHQCDSLLYYTIGTGIGAGIVINGQLVHGLVHPEAGHIRIPHDWQADPYPGHCPFHGDCFEGLACGPAINARWGQPAETLPVDHPAWELESAYIALAVSNAICTVSPEKIVLGGGVMQQQQLFPLVRQKVKAYLNGYIQAPTLLEAVDDYIVPPSLGNRSGVLGAVALACSDRD